MEIIREIAFQVIEILTLIFGVLGMTFSAMLVFAPNLTQNLSNILNRNVNVDEKIRFLDKDIEITDFFYSHHIVVGILFVCGAAFVLFFFYFSLDMVKFTRIFFGSLEHAFFGEIIVALVIWVGKITCLAALVFGFMLIFAPDKMKRFENKLNSWFETKSMVDRLDRTSNNVDSFFFRYPLPVGLTGAVISFLILSFSIINLLD